MRKGVYKRGQWITESCVVHKGKKAQGPQTMQTKPSLCRTGKQMAPTRGRAIGEVAPPPAGTSGVDIPYITVTMGRGAHEDSTSKTPSSW